MLVYKENKKHKPGSFGLGPPRWFPDWDMPCPDDLAPSQAQRLLEDSLEGADDAHPNRKARYAMDEKGRFFKGYCEATADGAEQWHGYEVREARVPRDVPARILKNFVKQGRLTRTRYKKLLGGAA
ncbi:hypothetical protein ACSRUE_31795 [Sorangium sp. KYC3313]|uniref:hypothetical protein n=1 Tax=Sorangium sp. KYC3313 TaxID=3449740 RepID=UPI003F88F0A3